MKVLMALCILSALAHDTSAAVTSCRPGHAKEAKTHRCIAAKSYSPQSIPAKKGKPCPKKFPWRVTAIVATPESGIMKGSLEGTKCYAPCTQYSVGKFHYSTLVHKLKVRCVWTDHQLTAAEKAAALPGGSQRYPVQEVPRVPSMTTLADFTYRVEVPYGTVLSIEGGNGL